jgi:exosortase
MVEVPNRVFKGRESGGLEAVRPALGDSVASARPKGSHNQRTLGQIQISSYGFIAGLLASLIVFWAPLQGLVKFSSNSESSYIPLIPPICAFLIIVRRHSIFRYAKPSPGIGIFTVAAAILLFFSSNLLVIGATSRLELSALAIVSTWCGVFVLCFGARVTRTAMLPLSLLLFMIPVPETVMNRAVEFLQHGSAVMSYHLFRAIGVPAVREGMTISLSRIVLEVAPECSGIRSSISLLILTLAGANLYLRSGWNKFLLVLTLGPLMILKNAIRIVTLSTLALYVNPGFLNGRLHQQGGIVFFLIAVAMLIPVVAVMRRCEGKVQPHGDSSKP